MALKLSKIKLSHIEDYLHSLQTKAMFSRACESGIRAAIHVAVQSLEGQPAYLKSVSAEIESSAAFTSRLLQVLVQHNVIQSVTGPGGGFEVDRRKMDETRLSHIVDAIDGDAVYRRCGLGMEYCDETPFCPVHEKFTRLRTQLKEMLETVSLFELAEFYQSRKSIRAVKLPR